MHTSLGEAGQECRAISSPAAYWFCREHSKRHRTPSAKLNTSTELGDEPHSINNKCVLVMYTRCFQAISRCSRKHQTQRHAVHTVQSRVGPCSNWRRGIATLWSGQAPGKSERSVSNWSCLASVNQCKYNLSV